MPVLRPLRLTSRGWRFALAAIALAGGWAHRAEAVVPQHLIDVGYDRLLNALGSATPNGTGVSVSIVEAIEGPNTNYSLYPFVPNPTASDFIPGTDAGGVQTVFTDARNLGPAMSGSVQVYSSHATTQVAPYLVGNQSSVAPGVNQVDMFEANDWLTNINRFSGGQPVVQNYRVQNFSWIGSFNGTVGYPQNLITDDANNVAALKRIDSAIDQANGGEGMIAVVGLNNGTNPAGIPYLFAHSYNAIAAGMSNGNHSPGLTLSPPSNAYGPGRSKPELVAPVATTSSATALISSGAASVYDVLLDGPTAGRNMEVVKAILLSGAEKKASFGWHPLGATVDSQTGARTITQPLDDTYGAGELDVWNNYLIAAGGQQAGSFAEPTAAAANNGWDYQDLKTNPTAGPVYYTLEIPQGTTAQELSITLTWNLKVNNVNAPAPALQNMDLKVYDSTGGFKTALVAESVSAVDNVEHLFFSNTDGDATNNLAAGTYTIEVDGAAGWDFGIAWRMSTLFDVPSGDFDDNGVIDANDFLTWQRGFGRLQGSTHAMGDADGDGDVDQTDLAIMQGNYGAGAVPLEAAAAAALAVGAVPEPTAAALLVAGLSAAAWYACRSGRPAAA